MIPPHQGSGAGIAIKADAWVSGWVGEWMVPRSYRIKYTEKGLLITKATR